MSDLRVALLVKPIFVDLMLDGKKTWEVRTKITYKRGRIHLAKVGTGQLSGSVCIVDCISVPVAHLPRHCDKHCIDDPLLMFAGHSRVFAWVLEAPDTFTATYSFQHPRGAVSWVRLQPTESMLHCCEEVLSLASEPLPQPGPARLADATMLSHEVA